MSNTTDAVRARPERGRGDRTRETLLAAASSAFARDGLHAVSTRQIAHDAGVNQALIGYHFGGKDGLYRAVVERAAMQLSALLEPLLDRIDDALRTRSASTVRGAVLDFAGDMVAALLRGGSVPLMQLILREQQEPTPAFELLADGVMRRTADVLAAAAGRLRPAADESQRRLTAISIMGQLIVFRTAHLVVLRQLGWAEIDHSRLVVLQAHARRCVAALLEAAP